MSYVYATKKEVASYIETCKDFLNDLRDLIKKYFTFSDEIIGSGRRHLVTKDTSTGKFDLDYNLYIQKDKQNLIDKPKEVKSKFIDYCNQLVDQYEFRQVSNNTSVITVKSKIEPFSFDLAIMCEFADGFTYKLKRNKQDDNNYFWEKKFNKYDLDAKVNAIKKNDLRNDVRDTYLNKKNYNPSNKSSFSLYRETINEIYDQNFED